MKNLLVILIITFVFSHLAWAQTVKGNMYVGGTFSFNATHNNSKNTNFNFNPSLGVFITDRLSIGGILGYGFSSNKTDNSKQTTNEYSIGAFCRQHFPVSDQFFIYIQENLGYSSQIYKYENDNTPDSEYTQNGFSISAGPGIIYFPVQKFGFEAGIGSLSYEHQSFNDKNSDSDPSKTNSYGLKIDLSTINLGLRYYF